MTVHPAAPFLPGDAFETHVHFGRAVKEVLAELIRPPWTLVISAGGVQRAEDAGLLAPLPPPETTTIIPSGLLTRSALADVWRPGSSTVIGIGAGSVLDAAKLIRLANVAGEFPAEPQGWITGETIGDGRLIALPTTAGSGSELTPTASLWDGGVKSSIDGPNLRPTDAIYDPALLISASPEIRTAALWDAIAHALEALWSVRANDVSNRCASFALEAIARALTRTDRVTDTILSDLSAASAAAGAAISITRTGIAHALSYPLTGKYGLRHGLAAGLYATAAASLLPDFDSDRAARIAEALDAPGGRADAMLTHLWRASGAGEFVTATVTSETIRSPANDALDPARAGLSVIPSTADVVVEIRRRAVALGS